MRPAFILTADTFTGVIGGTPFTMQKSHPKYPEVYEAWKAKNYERLEQLVTGLRAIEKFSLGDIRVKHGVLTYKGTPVSNKLADKAFELMNAGQPFMPLMRFLDNLMQNPSAAARDELFLFLEAGRMPITEDGYFLAYRKVNNEFLSYHVNPDGKRNRNMPGDVVKMARSECNPDRHETCSRGLHFCSFGYLSEYEGGNGKVVIVSINPRDVVAIPSDYKNQKGRCCQYEVIAEHLPHEKEDSLAGAMAVVEEAFEEGQTVGGKVRKIIKAIIGRFSK